MKRVCARATALGILFLGGCAAGTGPAPVTDRTLSPHATQGERIVVAGDTLYSIAWNADLDYKDVARWNAIPPPYLLQPGQRLRLTPPANIPPIARPTPTPTAKTRPAQTGKKSKSRPPSRPRTTPPPRPASADFGPWVWPVRGKVIHSYAAKTGSNGIDIAGTPGQAIYAAADGRVVYSGGGLRGYGQLIILKHNDDFLSAYAHNDKIFVKEGDVIKRGHRIAAMGSSGADRTKLHFEIRRGGVPVDPTQYLPKN